MQCDISASQMQIFASNDIKLKMDFWIFRHFTDLRINQLIEKLIGRLVDVAEKD